jgi:hypothetical protein
MVAARSASKPRRVTALRSSVTCLPPGLSAAEFAIDSTRVASIGSAPMTRTTRSLRGAFRFALLLFRQCHFVPP